jgi:hypothetical protein
LCFCDTLYCFFVFFGFWCFWLFCWFVFNYLNISIP